jgi:uncharacterized protein YndB with AHSA1/START domain
VSDAPNDEMEFPEYRCRTEVVVPASVDDVWAALVDLAEWTRWWVVVRVEPVDPDGGTVLRPGLRFRVVANRPGGPTRSWIVEVLDVHPKDRIDLLYAEGDMYGRTSWELDVVPGGTEVAYVYHGVRPLNAEMAASWRRWGSGSHECNMRLATLPGLARYVTGEPLDDAWREQVKAEVGECIAALPVLDERGPEA